jgi:hypothetical protein
MTIEKVLFFGFLAVCALWWIGHLGAKTRLGFWTAILLSIVLTPVPVIIIIIVLLIIDKRDATMV